MSERQPSTRPDQYPSCENDTSKSALTIQGMGGEAAKDVRGETVDANEQFATYVAYQEYQKIKRAELLESDVLATPLTVDELAASGVFTEDEIAKIKTISDGYDWPSADSTMDRTSPFDDKEDFLDYLANSMHTFKGGMENEKNLNNFWLRPKEGVLHEIKLPDLSKKLQLVQGLSPVWKRLEAMAPALVTTIHEKVFKDVETGATLYEKVSQCTEEPLGLGDKHDDDPVTIGDALYMAYLLALRLVDERDEAIHEEIINTIGPRAVAGNQGTVTEEEMAEIAQRTPREPKRPITNAAEYLRR